jgi:hypothetical protein
MAEFLRKEGQLTTADLAGRDDVVLPQRDEDADDMSRPKPVVGETYDAGKARATTFAFRAQRTEGVGAPPTPMFAESDIGDLRARWSNVQAGFVDEPRHAVENADKLVATAMERLAQGFASERSSLERQWSSGEQVSTEDLRVALQRYRSFFDRLLNA